MNKIIEDSHNGWTRKWGAAQSHHRQDRIAKSNFIFETLRNLTPDPWRHSVGFSDDIEEIHRVMFDATAKLNEIESHLNSWIRLNQPCLFGRMAASFGTLSYCILNQTDLESNDEAIREKIQNSRLAWRLEGYRGNKSGFIILALSEAMAFANPDANVLRLAQRLTQLYLDREIQPDTLYHDEIFLEKPGEERVTWKWLSGVNYFSAQGDKRWWHDHRIPGGMALSVNSVGHMIKSSVMGRGMADLNKKMCVEGEEWNPTKMDSSEKALKFAVKTIDNASEAVSGRATKLLSAPSDDYGNPITGCPFDMKDHSGKNCREYLGYYHMDITLPGEYFRSEVERPDDIETHTLDFTYIYENNIDNPDHFTMGIGERIREEKSSSDASETYTKIMKMEPVLAPLSDHPELDPMVPEEN